MMIGAEAPPRACAPTRTATLRLTSGSRVSVMESFGSVLVVFECQGNFQVVHAVAFGLGQGARTYVYLNGRQDELRRRQCGVALVARGHILCFADALAHMHVVSALRSHGGFPHVLIAAGSFV